MSNAAFNGVYGKKIAVLAASLAAPLIVDSAPFDQIVSESDQVALKFFAVYTGTVSLSLVNGASATLCFAQALVAAQNLMITDRYRAAPGEFFRLSIDAQAATTVDYDWLVRQVIS